MAPPFHTKSGWILVTSIHVVSPESTNIYFFNKKINKIFHVGLDRRPKRKEVKTAHVPERVFQVEVTPEKLGWGPCPPAAHQPCLSQTRVTGISKAVEGAVFNHLFLASSVFPRPCPWKQHSGCENKHHTGNLPGITP